MTDDLTAQVARRVNAIHDEWLADPTTDSFVDWLAPRLAPRIAACMEKVVEERDRQWTATMHRLFVAIPTGEIDWDVGRGSTDKVYAAGVAALRGET